MFKHTGVAKTALTSFCLEDPAKQAWIAYRAGLSEAERSDFGVLKKHLLLAYGGQDPRREAMQNLLAIAQKPSETVFVHFQRLLPDLTFGDKDASLNSLWQVYLFHRGLTPVLCEKVALNHATLDEFDKLEDIYSAALRYDQARDLFTKTGGAGAVNTSAIKGGAVVPGGRVAVPAAAVPAAAATAAAAAKGKARAGPDVAQPAAKKAAFAPFPVR